MTKGTTLNQEESQGYAPLLCARRLAEIARNHTQRGLRLPSEEEVRAQYLELGVMFEFVDYSSSKILELEGNCCFDCTRW